MAKFGRRSLKNLSECHTDLQRLFHAVIKEYDCAVIEGHRPELEQNEAYHSRKSKLKWPESKHNSKPSKAADVIPWPVDWNDYKRFYHFAGFVKGVASQMGIRIRTGIDWDMDNDFKDQTFHDMPHIELVEEDDEV